MCGWFFFCFFFFLANQSASLNCFQAWWPGGLLFFLKSTRWSSYFLMQSFAFDILCIRGAFSSGFPRGFLRPFLSRSNDAIQRVQVLVCFFRKIKLYRICETIIFVPSRRFGLAVQFFFFGKRWCWTFVSLICTKIESRIIDADEVNEK